jgi:uncharacterized Zn finger protein
MAYSYWAPYIPVAARRAKARREMEKLRKKGKQIHPITDVGRKIASSFWGKGWCDHLESFSDYENRLPRGRTYVRNGSVCHLEIRPGRIEAYVSGSELYQVTIDIQPLSRKKWTVIQSKCRGQIGSVLELLQGQLSDNVMQVVCDRKDGLFPQPGEIELKCSCPDWATMCKHVAAVLYGIGNRLDHQPELLFLLRDVDATELIAGGMTLPTDSSSADLIEESGLGELFGIEIDTADSDVASKTKKPRKKTAVNRPYPKPTPPSAAAKSTSKTATLKPAPRKTAAPAAPAPKTQKPMRRAAVADRKSKGSQQTQPRKVDRRFFDPQKPTGADIARFRQQMGLSVTEFAQALGISAPSVQRWERIAGPVRLYSKPLAALTRLQEELINRT